MHQPLPEHIGRFRVLGLLGQGAMGIVYRGRDDALERDVALKVMAAAALGDADNRQRFLREARASARLQHPNIVTIYELGEHEGQPFMALELLEGIDLQRAIATGIRPDPKLILPVVLQMLAGLGHAHAHGVVHRDVKPSNVFLPYGRPVKIMDFGVARLAATTLTTAGTVLGTPSYMSPEQVHGGHVDGRSDLFSAGLILYELLTGEKAFRAETVMAVLYKIAHEPPDLSLLSKDAAWSRLRRVLERVLAREPAARYADAAAMAQDLTRALLDLGGSLEWSAPPDLALLTLGTPRARAAPVDTLRAAVTAPAGDLVDLPLPGPRPEVTAVPAPTARASRATAGAGDTAHTRVGWRVALALTFAGVVALGLVLLAVRPRHLPAPSRPSATAQPPATAPLAPASPASPGATLAPQPMASLAPSARPAAPGAHAAPSPPPPTAVPHAIAATADGAPLTARLERAERLLEQGRYASALAEARAVLARAPGHDEARDIAQEAEALLLVESSLKEARAAWRRGDREAATAALRKGLDVRPNDARLLALWREITG